jgi:hypothetical protein
VVHGAPAPAPATATAGTGGAHPGASASSSTPVKVLIVGDSVAGTLGVGLGQVMSQYGVTAVNEGSPGCSVSMDQLVQVLWFTDPPGAPCQNGAPAALFAQWRAWVDQLNPDVVVYLARSDGAHVILLTSPFYDTGLQPSGQPWPEDDPGRVTSDNQIIESLAGTNARPLGPTNSHSRQRLFSGNGKVTVIDSGSWLSPAGHFATTVDGVRARCSDGVHLTVAGGQWLAKRILPVISLLGRAHQVASPSGSWAGDLAPTPPSWYAKLPCTTS